MEGNYRVDANSNMLLITVNPTLYPVEAVFMAANDFLPEAYVIIDGDLSRELLVRMIPKQDVKNKADYEELALRFNNELIRSSFYIQQSSRTAELRKILLQTSLLTNLVDSSKAGELEEQDSSCECQSEDDDTAADDEDSDDEKPDDEKDYVSDTKDIRKIRNYDKD